MVAILDCEGVITVTVGAMSALATKAARAIGATVVGVSKIIFPLNPCLDLMADTGSEEGPVKRSPATPKSRTKAKPLRFPRLILRTPEAEFL